MNDKKIIDVEIEKFTVAQEKEMDEKPLSFGSWLSLDFNEEELKKIVDNILNQIDEIEKEREPFFEKVKQFRNQYAGIVEETSMPFPGCFNLNVPITPKNVDACVAQTEEAFEDVDPKWMIQTPPDKKLIPSRDVQEKSLDYYSDTEMNDLEASTKCLYDAFILGIGWTATVFKREFIRVRDFVEYATLEEFTADYPKDYVKYPKYLEQLAMGKTIKLIVEKNEEVVRSPKLEHVEIGRAHV